MSGDYAVINLETIEREINELETRHDTSYRSCERLAWLYIVRDHLMPKSADELTEGMCGSEFLELSSGVPYRDLMHVIDDHLEAIRLLHPRSYDSIIDRIRGLR